MFPILKFLTRLKVIITENYERLDLADVEDNQEEFLTSLRALKFVELPQLVVLPKWIKRSTKTLQLISFMCCPNLTELPEWLPNFNSKILHNRIMSRIK